MTLVPEGHGLQRNGHRQNDRTLALNLISSPKLAPLHFKTEKNVAETELGAA